MANFKVIANVINGAILDCNIEFAGMTNRLWLCDYPVENLMQANVALALKKALIDGDSRRNKYIYPEACIADVREASESTRRGRPFKERTGRQRFDIVYAEGNPPKARVLIELKRVYNIYSWLEDLRKVFHTIKTHSDIEFGIVSCFLCSTSCGTTESANKKINEKLNSVKRTTRQLSGKKYLSYLRCEANWAEEKGEAHDFEGDWHAPGALSLKVSREADGR